MEKHAAAFLLPWYPKDQFGPGITAFTMTFEGL
jgi:hypothetical protein